MYGAQPLLLEPLHAGEQAGHGLHGRVDAEHADHGGDAVRHDLAQHDLGRLRAEALLAAAAEQVLVRVDEARG
jgi:hypothetical protein